MVKHIVFWKLKASPDQEANARKMKQLLEGLAGRVPGMRHVEVGIDFERSDAAWDVALYTEFDTREALAAYQDFPEHVAMKGFIASVREHRAVIDYEV